MNIVTLTGILLMAAPEGGAEGGGNPLGMFLPMILIFLVFYFLMIRPQAKKQKEMKKMLEELKQGDSVVTIGGIHATVAGLREQDNTVILKLGNDLKITVDRSAIGRKVEA